MLAIPHSVRIHLAVEPVDMRKSFNGLWGAVSERLQEDPKSGALFVFINKSRTRLKLLYWDGTGVWVLANTHAPHCSHWFYREDFVPLPSSLWQGGRSIWIGRRTERIDLYPFKRYVNAGNPGMDV